MPIGGNPRFKGCAPQKSRLPTRDADLERLSRNSGWLGGQLRPVTGTKLSAPASTRGAVRPARAWRARAPPASIDAERGPPVAPSIQGEGPVRRSPTRCAAVHRCNARPTHEGSNGGALARMGIIGLHLEYWEDPPTRSCAQSPCWADGTTSTRWRRQLPSCNRSRLAAEPFAIPAQAFKVSIPPQQTRFLRSTGVRVCCAAQPASS